MKQGGILFCSVYMDLSIAGMYTYNLQDDFGRQD